ncbi:amino acid ABC transporter substrate-binding protein [Geomonas propionica]|uniref:Amino acid ABC transporter substrate-binding protein n=1 Tax=Geomonas propionica TaxID=2798582 RepID=A0ABS0YXC4_9BACT|nr:amino acid ABC transporter substrate-binding protein [Geomonas propionica]MBJ6802632.1 amino acid ABC transporter substrate-binding protein [Geomonas propionica]
MKKIWVVLSSLLVLACAVSAFAGDGSFKRVKNQGALTIGLDDAFPPMGYRNDKGQLVGFDIDAAEEVGKRLGIKINWQPTAWDGVIHALNSKKFDCIWNGMTITDERKKEVAFTKPYKMDGQVAVVRFADKKIKKLADLKGAKVGVQKGSSAVEAVKKLPAAPAEVREYEDNPKALLDLESDRLDTVIIDDATGRDFIAKRPGKFRILPGNITKEPFGVAFRKEDVELREAVQKTLDKMVKDGTMAKISKKWFGEDITNPKKWK